MNTPDYYSTAIDHINNGHLPSDGLVGKLSRQELEKLLREVTVKLIAI